MPAMMFRVLLLVLPLVYNARAIKVPIQYYTSTEVTSEDDPRNDTSQASSEDISSTTDSYQLQTDDQTNNYDYPDPINDKIPIPSRYLLPPHIEASILSYPADPETDQGDWKPMAQKPSKVESDPTLSTIHQPDKLNTELELPVKAVKQWFNPKLHVLPISGEVHDKENTKDINIQMPSRHLQPPQIDSVPKVDFEIPVPATNLQPPLYIPEPKFKQNSLNPNNPPAISLVMKPPLRYSTPTKLYPKKYSKVKNTYKPIPIPMHEFQEGDIFEIPKAKPIKYFKTLMEQEDYIEPTDDEKNFLKYQQAQEKRKFREDEEAKKQQEFVDATVAEAFASPPESPSEQEASETGFYADNGQESYAAEVAEQPPVAEDEPPAPAERTEFRMHGLQGPNSYKFGYDTGKGKNRQFRYEERNNDGHVRGHYGYVDRHGKTQVVNYDAHPEHGFHAEGPFGKT